MNSDDNKNRRNNFQITLNSGQRTGIFTLAAMYLYYSLWRIIRNFWRGESSIRNLLLGIFILGGGATVILILAWRDFRRSRREEQEEEKECEESDPIPYSPDVESIKFKTEETITADPDDPIDSDDLSESPPCYDDEEDPD